YAEKEQSRLG
ncbi:MAG: hypothetical protein PWQ39_102, partial [Thermacetogenium sp.]|nr:hypothetical protein [Thermacetogenium sp.]